ncbi:MULTISPECIES: flagellar basal-body MS-ring/collar protein FliF [Ramlibacter]|uniref:Flagellar M-ring protein n=1 Tax=Ramlibacter pinisoli TaxID=2682844 RepID=A0A6N8IS57_9BURK|nr:MULTISPECIES: flagellar basal-body MS-ring/collar protein FliF [Ramlibacter]MBA2964784.1 flagellar M-ring protein FliF [Ramlibacter sp. CGMCC 1.13660]MVQ29749.1 flagellar M-ring protein FliF [Ramlibacter pinisoli]
MTQWWQGLQRQARVGVGIGLVLLLAAGLGTWWLWRPEPAVLFADLGPQDAALLAAELDKAKVPYTVAAGGTTLLVDRAQVHATRLKLMGKDLPLHGAVGFELFNNADFGMTEFAQKINYQRALQGELTRTILSFPEVRQARVHLALPEQGLFKPASAVPKAAVTLALRQNQALRGEQVTGIQRLLAAAVPGLAAHEVTIVDDHGVALSRGAATDSAAGPAASLDLKRDIESYLSRKAGAVLERALGPGQALASVDATLDMDQVRTTTEDVLPAPDGKGGPATGVLVRERESTRDSAAPDGRGDGRSLRGSSMQRDADYQAGRRLEQVVSQPGSVRRLHVVAVVRQALSQVQQDQVRQLVGAAVGASVERGDTVLVQAFDAAAIAPPRTPDPAGLALAAADVPRSGDHADPAVSMGWGAGVAVTAAALLASVLLWMRRRPTVAAVDPRDLTEPQRQLALGQVRAWLAGEPAGATAVAVPRSDP